MPTRLKEIMQQRCISVKQLSIALDMADHTLRTSLSRDLSNMSAILKFATALRVPVWEMFVAMPRVISYPKELYTFADDYMKQCITAAMRSRGMTQQQLADAMGKKQAFVGRVISEGNPTLATTEAICRALGIEVWELFISREEKEKIASGEVTPAPSQETATADDDAEPSPKSASGKYVAVPLLPNGSPDLSKLEWIDTPEGRILVWPMSEVHILELGADAPVPEPEEEAEVLQLTGDM